MVQIYKQICEVVYHIYGKNYQKAKNTFSLITRYELFCVSLHNLIIATK